MGLIKLFTALLHSNASNLVFEILKHDKIWGTICISVLPLQILGDSSPRPWVGLMWNAVACYSKSWCTTQQTRSEIAGLVGASGTVVSPGRVAVRHRDTHPCNKYCRVPTDELKALATGQLVCLTTTAQTCSLYVYKLTLNRMPNKLYGRRLTIYQVSVSILIFCQVTNSCYAPSSEWI